MKTYADVRPGKEEIRDIILGRQGKRGTNRRVNCFLTLPGPDLCCVKRGLESKRLHEDTTLIMAEYDPVIATKIKEECKNLPFKDMRLHGGNLFDLDLSKAPKIDLAYVDLESTVSGEQLLWVHEELLPRMRVGGEVVFTQAVNRGGMIHRLVQTAPATAGQIQMQISNQLGDAITVHQAVTYSVLQASLVNTFNSWFKSYRDSSPMEVYGFFKNKSKPYERQEAYNYIKRIADDYS